MYDEQDRPITTAEAVREWAWVVGAEHLDCQWLLSDYDTWERNPHYTGPAQRHPEDYLIDEIVETEDEIIARCNQAMDEYWAAEEAARQADYEAALIEREEYSWPDYTRGDKIW